MALLHSVRDDIKLVLLCLSTWRHYLVDAMMGRRSLSVAIVASTLCLASVAPEVQINDTTLIGAPDARNVEFFGGIPYVKPPVNELRFRPPVPSTLKAGVLNATSFGNDCLQADQIAPGEFLGSEDCLTVNVFRPVGTNSNDRLPVMVWIHGGGFAIGASSLYNASLLVARSVARGTPIIYANLNYRLGPFGFPTGSEAQSRGAVNLGLKDQLAALKWVHTNIRHFGGDPSKMTLFGESAGAISVSDLLLNSNVESLVRGAIMESGAQYAGPVAKPPEGTALWQALVAATPSCANTTTVNNTFDCMTKASAQEVITADFQVTGGGFDWYPLVDGPGGVIPDFPTKLFSKGEFSKIPFITGTNLDEGTAFITAPLNTTEELVAALETNEIFLFRALARNQSALLNIVNGLLDLYPDIPADGSPFGTGDNTFGNGIEWKRGAAATGDLFFLGPRRTWINAAASHGVKTFCYLFIDSQIVGLAPGVAHGSEIAYVQGQAPLGLVPGPGFSRLSPQVQDYWISFAVSLDPNDKIGTIRPQWPEFTEARQVVLQLNSTNITTIPDTFRKSATDFINKVVVENQQ